MDEEPKELVLSPYRALDLTDEKGFLCGKMLGDLGADVIKIEKPGGDPSRRIGPFYKDIPDPEKSLYWFAYNSNKRGITLNIETQDGRELFKRLVRKSDFVIESFPPGYMEELGLGYSALSQINPGIIMTSISHFGQTGPYRDYKGCDIVDMAMGNIMYVCGDPDRPPVRVGSTQAYLHAGAEAAAGAMLAFYRRQLTGEGQWVDVSVQQSTARATYNVRLAWDLSQQVFHRVGPFRGGIAGYTLRRETWPCKDGAVSLEIIGGALGDKTNRALVQWMDEEGMADDFLKNMDWEKWDIAQASQEFLDQISESFIKFFMTHTSAELYEGAKQRRIILYPVTTPKDIAENTQLAARGFWEEVEHPELNDTLTYAGATLKAAEMPVDIRRRSPLIGEHNEEIYGEMGLSREELLTLKQGNII